MRIKQYQSASKQRRRYPLAPIYRIDWIFRAAVTHATPVEFLWTLYFAGDAALSKTYTATC
jgi:hypothetical protein